jgi:hypothetical protein
MLPLLNIIFVSRLYGWIYEQLPSICNCKDKGPGTTGVRLLNDESGHNRVFRNCWGIKATNSFEIKTLQFFCHIFSYTR